jgi:iron complex outermembrane recepter protein
MRTCLSVVISAVLLNVSLAKTTYAQGTPAAASSGLDEIIVTARRKEERLQDVPISITVFSQEELSRQNVLSTNDLARYTPSLQTNARYGTESASFSIRGFVQENQTAPSVATYFADVPAPRSQGGTSSGNGAGPGAFFDLQNVQVLKGPQGTLFGRNTTGGAVLLVPQKPTGELGGYAEISAGNYDMKRYQGVLNAPLSDAVRVRLGIDHEDRDGYLRNVSGIGPGDFADVGYTAVRLGVVADLTQNLENYTIASYSRSSTNGFYPKLRTLDNASRDPFPALRVAQLAATAGDYWDVANGLPEAHQKIVQSQLINTTTWQATDALSLKNIVSYGRFQQAQASNIYGENGYQNGTTPPYYAVNIIPEPGKNNASEQTFTEEVQLQGRIGDDRFTYQTGLYYERSKPLDGFQGSYSANQIACTDIPNLQCQNAVVTNAAGVVVRTITGFVQNSRTEYDFTDFGAYAQGTFKFTNEFSLTGGIRYTQDKTEGVGQVLKISFPTANTPSYGCAQPVPLVPGGTPAEVQADPSLCNFYRTEKSSKPTWLLDLDYTPIDDFLLYGKYARGYRQGGVNVSSYGLETWKPEQVDLYELGLKTSWQAAVSGHLDLAVFYNNFTDQQIAINTLPCSLAPTAPACAGIPASESPSPAQGIGNGGESTIKGLEVDASFTLFRGFNLSLGYAYLDTVLESIVVPPVQRGFALYVPNAIVGGPLQNTPKDKYAITPSYTLPLNAGIGNIVLSGTYTYQTTTFGNNSSVTLKTLPEQTQVNLNANWNAVMGSRVDVGLFATNVTNEKYFVFATGASFGFDSVVLNEPQMWGVRVKYRFGE